MRLEGKWEGSLEGDNVFVLFCFCKCTNCSVGIFCMRYCLKLVTHVHTHAHTHLPTTPVTLLTQSSVCRVDDSHITHIKINNTVRFQPDPHHYIQGKILGHYTL